MLCPVPVSIFSFAWWFVLCLLSICFLVCISWETGRFLVACLFDALFLVSFSEALRPCDLWTVCRLSARKTLKRMINVQNLCCVDYRCTDSLLSFDIDLFPTIVVLMYPVFCGTYSCFPVLLLRNTIVTSMTLRCNENVQKTDRKLCTKHMDFANFAALCEALRDNPPALKVTTETLGFQHLDLEVTAPRHLEAKTWDRSKFHMLPKSAKLRCRFHRFLFKIESKLFISDLNVWWLFQKKGVFMFRDAIIELFDTELQGRFTRRARSGLMSVLNYVGGA